MDNQEKQDSVYYNMVSDYRMESIKRSIRNILWETLEAKRLTVVRKAEYQYIREENKTAYHEHLKRDMYNGIAKLLQEHTPNITEKTEKEMVTDSNYSIPRQEDVTEFRLEYMVITPEDYKNLIHSLYSAVEQAMI